MLFRSVSQSRYGLVENEKLPSPKLQQTQPTDKSPRKENSTNNQPPNTSSNSTSPTTAANSNQSPPPLPEIDSHKKDLLLEIKNFKIDNNRTLRAEYNRMRLEQLKDLSNREQVILTAIVATDNKAAGASNNTYEFKDGPPSPIPSPTSKQLESPSKKQNIYEDSSLDDSGVECRAIATI